MTEFMGISLIVAAVLMGILMVIQLKRMSLQTLILGLMGAIVGLLIGALASVPLSMLPGYSGGILPVGVSLTLTIIGAWITLSRRRQLASLLPKLKLSDVSVDVSKIDASKTNISSTLSSNMPSILVDTSAIIDGRIADIAITGFMPGRLIVPQFVLAELQNIADSEEPMRRSRGRRGLEVLAKLRDMPGIEIEIISEDVSGVREVDAKLVTLAQKHQYSVLTTDYNLNQVAGIQGVRVLNVNELSNAIRPVVIPGEQLMVRVVQPGKEKGQGVGYLTDGTMIVVDKGDTLIGQEVLTEVTRVFQTVAGKMIFAAPLAGERSSQRTGNKPIASASMSAEESIMHIVDNQPSPSPRRRDRGKMRTQPTNNSHPTQTSSRTQ